MIPTDTSTLIFFVNGKKIIDNNVDPEWTLLQYLRNKLRLCGTKLGCGEGGCGACTIMVSKYDRENNKILHLPVNACLAPICSMHGLAVTTIEGIGSTKTKLHPVQERIAKAHGSQCGFCTPGIVMSMYTLLRNMPKPTMKDMEIAFQGNLCRCTGYRAIIEGYKTFAEDWEIMQNCRTNGSCTLQNNACGMGEECCRNKNKIYEEEEKLFDKNEFTPFDPSQEPIFPPELKVSDILDLESLYFKGEIVSWYRPTNLKDLLELKSRYPDGKIIVGNTEVGVEVKFKHFIYPVLIQPILIPEMIVREIVGDGVIVGASVTLMDMEDFLCGLTKSLPEYKTRLFKAIVDMLHYFAGKQIRSVAAVGGNIMTGSPISDLNPVFMSARIDLFLSSKMGTRTIKMDENFFTGYRRNIVAPNEILVAIKVPFTIEEQYFFAYKQARRRDDDIAIVNSAINVIFKPKSNVIEDINLAFGGMAPTTVIALNTRKNLRGLSWDQNMLEKAYENLMDDLPLSQSAPGGMINYRRTLPLSFFFRTFLKICRELQVTLPSIKINPQDMSGLDAFHYKIPKSSQYYQIMNDKQNPIGQPIPHVSAYKQATGEAIYCDDIPFFENEIYLALVYSTKSHAKILSIDPSIALKQNNIIGFISASDIPSDNSTGPIFHDEQVFYDKVVTSQGQLIGGILANNQTCAQRAARMVKVQYEELSPIIVTIDDAIKHNSFFPIPPRKMERGEVDSTFKIAPHIIEGECRNGYQEQFYLETHSVVVVPKKEDDELDIYSSTQNPSEISHLTAHMLGVPQNRINVKVKRIGGGFGGKESRGTLVALPAALAAWKYKRPVRIMLDRDEDMAITGGRHPFLIKYKIGFDDAGKLLASEVSIYCNAGYSLDLSPSILERAMFHYENSYYIPNARVLGYICRTNLPSNTAFRGFGGPQGMFAAENIIRHVAEYLEKDPCRIANINLYKEGDLTHYNQTLTYCTVIRCWNECLQKSDYYNKKNQIEKYNRENRWKKRGISIVPTKFGIGFNVLFLNQAGALLLVYRDGSVLLSHGGVEVGQGLHTKMIQVASTALGIDMSKIHIHETATDKVPNTSATAASSGSDLNGMAVLNACNIINERLKKIKEENPKGTWEEWINSAYLQRICLSAAGFYKTPDIGYDVEKNTGMPFNYFTYGTAVTEVEIDCLTGDHQIIRTDIVMDLGESLNPAIDIGQIEGGFIQGYGLFVMEEMMYSPTGHIFTKGPGAYKIPGFADIPLEFNVSLLKGAPNPRAVYSSKGVGEPPLFLASSVLFAIKEAIKAAREDSGVTERFQLDAPATAAKIRMGCQDHLVKKVLSATPKSDFTPWNIIP